MLDLADQSVAQALAQFIEELLSAAGIDRPPVDAFRAASALRLTVAGDSSQSGRARLARLNAPGKVAGQTVVFLNREPRPERRHWAVAHEIGEHLAPEIFQRTGLDPRESSHMRERLANEFARRFLLPEAWFAGQGARLGWRLPDLKNIFATASNELIAQRMLDLASPLVVTVFDQGRITWRRTNMGVRPPPLAPEESACQRHAHQRGEPASHQMAELAIRAWPVHEPGWKREIIRAELRAVF